MTIPDVEEIQRAMTPQTATREQLEELVDRAGHRLARAHSKLRAAAREQNEASDALAFADAALAAFLAANPDPQLAIPFSGEAE